MIVLKCDCTNVIAQAPVAFGKHGTDCLGHLRSHPIHRRLPHILLIKHLCYQIPFVKGTLVVGSLARERPRTAEGLVRTT